MSSSTIKSVGYDEVRRVLEVEFKAGGVYQYADVPPDLPPKFVASDSAGHFFHQHVKGKYKATRAEASA